MTEQKPLNIHQRIHAVMKDVKIIVKEKKTVNGMYRFVSHDAVVKEIRPLLIKHGIVVIPSVKSHEYENFRTTLTLEIIFVNIDNPEEFFITHSCGYGLDKQDKGIGKAYSYAFKYAMLKTFCCETGDDPEQDNVDYKPKSVHLATQENTKKSSLVSKSNLDELRSLLKRTNTSLDVIYNFMQQEQIKSLDELSNSRAETAIKALRTKLIKN